VRKAWRRPRRRPGGRHHTRSDPHRVLRP
jgi:hypothetical protein